MIRLVCSWLLAQFLVGSAADAGLNPYFTIPLHYKVSSFEVCDGFLPVDCATTRPTVTAVAGQPAAVFVMIHNHVVVSGIQTAFEWSPWNLVFSLWDCQPGQLDGGPVNPGGPVAGTLSTAFSCVTGPELMVVGRMFFTGVDSGCIRQVQSAFPFGIHVLDCSYGVDQISDSPADEQRLGRICVGSGGHDACDRVLPVEAATWGRIKASYGHD